MKNFTSNKIQSSIKDFFSHCNESHRYVSFDYCFYYFYRNRNNLIDNNLEMSCMALWSYLGSWGMLRGSSELLREKNYKVLIPVIEYINQHQEFYEMNLLENKNIDNTLLLYEAIKKALNLKQKNQKTLITKIMLGVYACCPAFDTNLCKTFGLSTQGDLKRHDLETIVEFYKSNRVLIDQIVNSNKYDILSFGGQPTNLKYNAVKMIDMFGFNYKVK